MLLELGLRGRVELEKTGSRRRSLLNRKIIFKSDAPTGDVILDEALKHIKETDPPDTVQNWIDLLSGKSFNTMKQLMFRLNYPFRNFNH